MSRPLAISQLALWSVLLTACPSPRPVQPEPDRAAEDEFCSLHYGLYWFGADNQAQRYQPGTDNPYFDPARPSIIYVHGWEIRTTERRFRESFHFEATGLEAASDWRNAGYNLGVFYWNQISDEPEVKDAEAKIWISDSQHRMRWRDCDGKFHDDGQVTKSAAELLADAYAGAFSQPGGGPVRLVGHSLGNQMVLRASTLLAERIDAGKLPADKLPVRVALLDPYWSKGGKDYLQGDSNARRGYQQAEALAARGVALEMYRSSDLVELGFGEVNEPMRALAAYAELSPKYLRKVDQSARHVAARDWYFLSRGAPPSACRDDGLGCAPGESLPSAATSDEGIRRAMRAGQFWRQQGGQETPTTGDDLFGPIPSTAHPSAH